MDQFGDLVLSCSIGYNGSRVFFTDDTTLCFLNSNCLKFIDVNDETTKYLNSPGDGIQTLAVNASYGFVAFSEDGLEAKIFIYDVNELEQPRAILAGGNSLGYSCLSFANNGSILGACSNVPDNTLTVWNWVSGHELCLMVLQAPLSSLHFNPLNWRQFCGNSSTEFNIWHIEQVNDQYHLETKPITLPYIDGTFGLEFINTAPSGSRPTTGHGGLSLTKSSMAGLVSIGREKYDPTTSIIRCHPVSHCWASGNLIYVGCTEKMLLAVDVETQNVTLLKYGGNADDEMIDNKVLPFDVECLVMHGSGLFVAGKEGILRCLQIQDDSITVKFDRTVGSIVSSLSFSPSYEKIAIGSNTGTVYLYNNEKESLYKLVDDVADEVIGIGCLPANSHFVTCKASGLLQVWTTKESLCIGTMDLGSKICCLATSSSSTSAFLGTENGSLVVVDITKLNQPRCVYEISLYTKPLTKLSIDDTGTILVTGADDNKLFILNAKLSQNLEVLGHTTVPGSIFCLSCANVTTEGSEEQEWKVLAGICSSGHAPGCNQLVELTIKEDLLLKHSSLYMDDTKLLKDVSISKQVYLLKTFLYDICIASQNMAFAVTHTGGQIAKFTFSDYESTQSNLVMEAAFTYSGHGLPGGCISISCHGKWLVSGSPDGYIIVRAIGAMNNAVSIQCGNYRTGGLTHVCFSADAQLIHTVSKDGCISTWGWNYTPLGKSKAVGALEHYREIAASRKLVKHAEDDHISAMPTVDLAGIENNGTWLDKAIGKAHGKEDEKYATVKNSLRNDIENLRNQVLSLISTNEELPDIEKLERHQFTLDVEERQKVVAGQEKQLNELRAQIELDDTATQYLWHKAKEECWDNMAVKGRSLNNFPGTMKVDNMPMRRRDEIELKEIEVVLQQRKIEKIQSGIRKSILPADTAVNPSLVESNGDGDEELADDEKSMKKESAATYGSLGFLYGGYNEFLESQFALSTKNQKKNQIVILKDCIHNIKTAYNKHFDEVYNFKIQEIRRINERNVRIQKIMKDLDLNEKICNFSMDAAEEPERLLEVQDCEVLVEKYISEEESKRLEEEAMLEEERRRAENSDNIRARALDMMMAGRLETNLEEELKKEVEQPEFMSKSAEDWNEEEQKLAKEYEKKKTQLNEEREKFRKTLETEFKKLQTMNTEAIVNFDERLNQLFQRKTKTELVLLQEELKIVRLQASILIDEELESREEELLTYLELKKDDKQRSSLSVGDARREVDAFRDAYETLVADDRTLDKMFRKEFNDTDQHTIDVLYKFFKRRPRAQRTLKAAYESHQDAVYVQGNPFNVRPSSSRAASAAVQTLEKAMQELDGEQHIPENISVDAWKKMVMLRRTKVEKEQQLKEKALILADMNAFMQKQIDKDEDLKLTIEKTFEDIQRLREERLRFHLNLEVQLLLKQGQVEVAACNFIPDYSQSLLIHRSAVEDLNATIKTLGDAKLASMRESKEFRKGIHQLAWELKEMFMKAEDLQTAAHDLQLLRVTKELQVFLSETDQRKSKQQEITTLEKTIDMYNKMHGRNLQDRKRVIRRLRSQIRQKTEENNKFDIDLEELSLSVAERRNIDDVNADHDGDSGASKRMQDIITRRKLVDLAKAQASEIGMLRAEVERLRMRTFPALVQLDPR